jgi:hypothetical protein
MTNLEKVKEKENIFSFVLWSSHDEKYDGGTCMQPERTDKKPTVCISMTSNIKTMLTQPRVFFSLYVGELRSYYTVASGTQKRLYIKFYSTNLDNFF